MKSQLRDGSPAQLGPMLGCTMSFALLYWILMIFFLVLNVWATDFKTVPGFKAGAPGLLLFILLVLLGWSTYGAPVHGG